MHGTQTNVWSWSIYSEYWTHPHTTYAHTKYAYTHPHIQHARTHTTTDTTHTHTHKHSHNTHTRKHTHTHTLTHTHNTRLRAHTIHTHTHTHTFCGLLQKSYRRRGRDVHVGRGCQINCRDDEDNGFHCCEGDFCNAAPALRSSLVPLSALAAALWWLVL